MSHLIGDDCAGMEVDARSECHRGKGSPVVDLLHPPPAGQDQTHGKHHPLHQEAALWALLPSLLVYRLLTKSLKVD